MFRRAGHSWAQPEQHQHNAGCGHHTEQPAIQRSAVHDILRASGRPLDEATRSDMGARLGADFSDVRIHDDSAAKASAAEVGARAMSGSVLAGPDVQCAPASESSVVAPTVQRNLQDHLTDRYWQERAAKKKPVKAPTKASKGRAGDHILLDIGPKLIKELAGMCAGKSETELDRMGRLELFRTMEATEVSAAAES
ncbi:eCIS core domain-containing protein [Streptomyces sp. NPDC004393]